MTRSGHQRWRLVETALETCTRGTKSPCSRTASVLRRSFVAIAIATVAAASLVHSALAYDRPPLIEQVASTFALRFVDVRCPTTEEWVTDPIWGTAPNPQRAWGYTDIVNDFSVIHPALCTGAAAVTDTAVPAWQRATGVLVLVH